jgi:hypothetical protein
VLWPNPKRGPWRVACKWADVDDYARLIGVEIESLVVQKGPALTMETLTASVWRKIPLDHVADLVLQKIRETQAEFNVGPSEGKGPARKGRGAKPGRRPLTTEDLQEVAAIYRRGGTSPTKAVADQLHISRSAAAKRVVRAREAGLLAGTLQGRASGPPTSIRLIPGKPRRNTPK